MILKIYVSVAWAFIGFYIGDMFGAGIIPSFGCIKGDEVLACGNSFQYVHGREIGYGLGILSAVLFAWLAKRQFPLCKANQKMLMAIFPIVFFILFALMNYPLP